MSIVVYTIKEDSQKSFFLVKRRRGINQISLKFSSQMSEKTEQLRKY